MRVLCHLYAWNSRKVWGSALCLVSSTTCLSCWASKDFGIEARYFFQLIKETPDFHVCFCPCPFDWGFRTSLRWYWSFLRHCKASCPKVHRACDKIKPWNLLPWQRRAWICPKPTWGCHPGWAPHLFHRQRCLHLLGFEGSRIFRWGWGLSRFFPSCTCRRKSTPSASTFKMGPRGAMDCSLP